MSDIDDILDRLYDETQPEDADSPTLMATCKRCGEGDLIWSRLTRAQKHELTNCAGRRHTCKAAPEAFPVIYDAASPVMKA